MKKLATGLILFAIGALGFIISLNFTTGLCTAFGAQVASKCLIAAAVFLVITITGSLITRKEIYAGT